MQILVPHLRPTKLGVPKVGPALCALTVPQGMVMHSHFEKHWNGEERPGSCLQELIP